MHCHAYAAAPPCVAEPGQAGTGRGLYDGFVLYGISMPYKNPEEQRRYQRERNAACRAAWLAENGPCAACGSVTNLQVDHIDPSSKVAHAVWSWAPNRRQAELAKCQVLCKQCHEAKTAKENSIRMGGLRHGTDAMYGKGKCRCDLCRNNKNAATAATRARRKARAAASVIPLGD